MSFTVRDAEGEDLVRGSSLLADALAFSQRDAIPPWLLQTTAAHGGCALAAVGDGEVIGLCAAMPGAAGELFVAGLAVAPEWRCQGIGRALLGRMRDAARDRGYRVIRWTAEPLSMPALRLYLDGVGARLVAYLPELYARVRPAPIPPDDVLLEWPVDAPRRTTMRPACRVELPFAVASLGHASLQRWRTSVRRRMTRAIEAGQVGTTVVVDGDARRAWVLFSERETESCPS